MSDNRVAGQPFDPEERDKRGVAAPPPCPGYACFRDPSPGVIWHATPCPLAYEPLNVTQPEPVAAQPQTDAEYTRNLRIRMGQCTDCGEMPDECHCKAAQPATTPTRKGFTNGLRFIVSEKDCSTKWGSSSDGNKNGIKCGLCGHRFAVGEGTRWVYANGKSPSYCNFFTCDSCDGPDVLERRTAAGNFAASLDNDEVVIAAHLLKRLPAEDSIPQAPPPNYSTNLAPIYIAEQIFFHVLLKGGKGNPFTQIRSQWFSELAAAKIRELLTPSVSPLPDTTGDSRPPQPPDDQPGIPQGPPKETETCLRNALQQCLEALKRVRHQVRGVLPVQDVANAIAGAESCLGFTSTAGPQGPQTPPELIQKLKDAINRMLNHWVGEEFCPECGQRLGEENETPCATCEIVDMSTQAIE